MRWLRIPIIGRILWYWKVEVPRERRRKSAALRRSLQQIGKAAKLTVRYFTEVYNAAWQLEDAVCRLTRKVRQ